MECPPSESARKSVVKIKLYEGKKQFDSKLDYRKQLKLHWRKLNLLK